MALLLNRNDGQAFVPTSSPPSSPYSINSSGAQSQSPCSPTTANSSRMTSTPNEIQQFLTPDSKTESPFDSHARNQDHSQEESSAPTSLVHPNPVHAKFPSLVMNSSDSGQKKINESTNETISPTRIEHCNSFNRSTSSFVSQVTRSYLPLPDVGSCSTPRQFLPGLPLCPDEEALPNLHTSPLLHPWHYALLAHHALSTSSESLQHQLEI